MFNNFTPFLAQDSGSGQYVIKLCFLYLKAQLEKGCF